MTMSGICENCDRPFKRRKGGAKDQGRFCSRSCEGTMKMIIEAIKCSDGRCVDRVRLATGRIVEIEYGWFWENGVLLR